jgi:glyoxylase-like metal-dependent hydrolase (beta-lactamase superfamily II)
MTEAPLQVEIRQPQPGYEGFFCAWVIPGEVTVVVDTGPAASAGNLVAALEDLKIEDVDYVLMTHIHIDHAGGLKAVLDRYPRARAICHAAGVRFLVKPDKLWQGSLAVLGAVAEAYGPPPPVPGDRLLAHTEARVEGLGILETPGHAPHHLAYTWRGHLYSGEAGGNLLRVGGKPYLRPATPPRFFLEVALASVDRLLALPDQPIHYAHFDREASSREMLGRFRAQLLRWEDIVSSVAGSGGMDQLEDRCIDALLSGDPEVGAFGEMSPVIQARERNFIRNSVRGYLGYIKGKGAA